jgi:nitrogen regulatory protein PII
MKLVRCVLSLDSWDKVMCSLRPVTLGMTVHCGHDISPETNRKAFYRGREYDVPMPGVILEIVTDDSWLNDILETIRKAHIGALIGRRAIQILPLEASYRIRDGFMDMP